MKPCDHGWEDEHGEPTACPPCMEAEIERLNVAITNMLDELDEQAAENRKLQSAIDRLTECDLQSIDWEDRTITLRYPAGIDGLEVRAGLKIKADLTPMLPDPDTEPPVADQTYKM